MDESTAQDLEAAHRALSADAAYQQSLPGPPPELKPPTRIEWLDDFVQFLADLLTPLGPILQFCLYGAVILLILYVLYNVVRALIDRRDRLKALINRDRDADVLSTVDMRPDEHFASNLLEQADALAARGQFGEAIRLLLLSSVQDMQERIHKRIGVSLTAREIGQLGTMPDDSRAALQRIIHTVEINVFALQDVGASDFQAARHDYTIFAFQGAPK